MGQKSSRFLFVASSRNGDAGRYNDTCESVWFAKDKNQYGQYVVEDYLIRKCFDDVKISALISSIYITRDVAGKIDVVVKSARISAILSKEDLLDKIRKNIKNLIGKDVTLSVRTIKNSETDATIVSYIVASAISSGKSYKKSAKLAIEAAMRNGAFGVKIIVSGRLNGVDIARSEKFAQGSIPLHTLRADIDYNHIQANTKYGVIGVKVWINRK